MDKKLQKPNRTRNTFLYSICKSIIKAIYRVKIKGLEHYQQAGSKRIIIANHSSFLDVPLLACFLPDRLCFAIHSQMAIKWWLKPLLRLTKTISIDHNSSAGIKNLIREVNEEQPVVIFPEGRLSTTGSLMKIYEGPGLIADKTDATILAIRIDGVQFTRFAPSKNFFRRHTPQITITICPPQNIRLDKNIKGRRRREKISIQVHDMMTRMMFDSKECNKTLFSALLQSRKLYEGSRTLIEDVEGNRLTYNKLVIKSYALGSIIRNQTGQQKSIGIMLATSPAAVVLFFAAQAISKTPAMINFTAGFSSIYKSCQVANIKTIYTAKKFIETAKLEPLIESLIKHKIEIIYLEDMAAAIGLKTKIFALCKSQFNFLYRRSLNPESYTEPSVILFTSGSEGTPKGVALSHKNIISNCYQVLASIDVSMNDTLFNTLPMFHCFGLTMGTILPILNGFRAIFYPSPLHYRVIPEIIYDYDITILFSTNTFLAGYAQCAHGYDLYRVRYIFAGAEALRESTRKLYSEKFGVRVFEGYGVTETSPVAAVNTCMYSKPGTVGRVLPGMEAKIEPVEDIPEGGRLLLKGPNIMLGYLDPQQPGKIQPQAAWYDTGDIVNIDKDGFITILGRAKRFAKLGGEMISLTAVENLVQSVWPDSLHAVISQPDERKGERLILITEHEQCNINELLTFAREHGYPELMIPKNIKHTNKLPILGSGKVDYVTLLKQAQQI